MTWIVYSLPIARSKTLLIYLIFAHTLALLTLVSLISNLAIILSLIVILIVSFIYYCYQYQWLRSDNAMLKLDRDADGQWYMTNKVGRQHQLFKLTSCFVAPKLVLLHFSGERFWKRKTITVCSGSVDVELFRQLRVYCRDPKTFSAE